MPHDRLSPERRSWNMSRIRSKNTKPEIMVRSVLHRMGFRFRVHYSKLPGCPDIVLPKHRVVIFVHGCFWHRHPGCRRATTPGSNKAFWKKKFERNVARDQEKRKDLEELGWRVLTIWECSVLEGPDRIAQVVEEFMGRRGEYTFPSKRELLRAAQAGADYGKCT
ncbi:MAG: very short patch repair endonuclease [Chitinispirillaceae bacterium]